MLVWAALLSPLAAQSFGDFTYSKNINVITLTGYTGGGGVITVPDTIEGLPVLWIGNGAFLNRTALTSVTIPASVISIGNLAFSGCTSLTSIILPHSVTSIGTLAFSRCVELTSVTIPNSVTSIGTEAFSGCAGLTSITLPNSITSIGDRMFSDCTALTGITLPDSVTSIGNQAFYLCTNLATVFFEGHAPSIGFSTFPPVARDFTIYYYEGKTGFTASAWRAYPLVRLSVPSASGGELRVDVFTHQGDVVTLVVAGLPGWTYELQRRADLRATEWTSILTLGPQAAAGPVILTDPTAPASQAFYRVLSRAP